MKYFCQTHLSELLAPSIKSDSQIAASAHACEIQIKQGYRAVPDLLLLARLAEDSGFNSPVAMLPPLMRLADCTGGLQPLSDELLDLLAWQLHVEGYELSQDRQAKVQIIQESLFLHRKKGTPWSPAPCPGAAHAARCANSGMVQLWRRPLLFPRAL